MIIKDESLALFADKYIEIDVDSRGRDPRLLKEVLIRTIVSEEFLIKRSEDLSVGQVIEFEIEDVTQLLRTRVVHNLEFVTEEHDSFQYKLVKQNK